jgi:hypothetical protein
MTISDQAPSPDTPILARDQEGEEHVLRVADHQGLISIADDRMFRILSPLAAVSLVLAVVEALGCQIPLGLLDLETAPDKLEGALSLLGGTATADVAPEEPPSPEGVIRPFDG